MRLTLLALVSPVAEEYGTLQLAVDLGPLQLAVGLGTLQLVVDLGSLVDFGMLQVGCR